MILDDRFAESAAASVLDAIPDPIFVLDGDARIYGMNSSARELIGPDAPASLRRRCGTVLKCLHEATLEGECGETERCPECVVRRSLKVIEGEPALVRQRYDMEIVREQSSVPMVFWITASAFELDGERMALLVMEDITELVGLREIVPICAGCKKVRTGDAYWEMVETYLNRYFDLKFSHGLCPECMEKHYGHLRRELDDPE
jgi:PAS domain-containing protein